MISVPFDKSKQFSVIELSFPSHVKEKTIFFTFWLGDDKVLPQFLG